MKLSTTLELLKDSKENLTDEIIDSVLKSENDVEYDVGFHLGVKTVIQNEQVKEAVGSLSHLIGEQEEKHYSEWYGVENPNDIPTEELEEHAYRSIRILVDIFGA